MQNYPMPPDFTYDRSVVRFVVAKGSLEKRERQLERELADVRASLEVLRERIESDLEARKAEEKAAADTPSSRLEKKVQEMDSKFDPPKPPSGRTVTTIVTPAPDPDRKPN